ncbi:MAG: hypothetical protein ABIV13_05090 [Fimbriimonadales bacterium]
MASKGVTLAGIVASLALVGVTIAVFSVSQLRGPEGSMHKFLMAVADQNFEEVNDLSFGTQQEKALVASFVSQAFRSGGRYQVLDVSQKSGQARVGVLFRFPNGQELPWVFVVRRSDRKWLIDAAMSTRPGPIF